MFAVDRRSDFAHAVARVEEGLALLAAQEIDPVAPVELGEDIRVLSGLLDRLALQRTRRLALFEREDGFVPSGDGSATSWLRQECHLPGFEAERQMKLARQLQDLEETQKAVEAGQIGIEHALEIARATDDMGLGAEGELLQVAVEKDPGQMRQAARELRHRTDPEALKRLALEQQRRRKLRLFELPDGMTGVEGALPPEGGVALKLCLQSVIGIPAKDDERNQGQRNADGLMELCRRQLDSGRLPSIGGRKPHLMVIVQEETLAGLPGAPAAQLEGAGAISVETAKRLTEAGTMSVLTVDEKGVPLRLGRSRRLASEPQRRVLAARYSCCCFTGCTREARYCVPHHLDEWWKGGGTDVDRMVLLCSKHHPMVFEGGYVLELGPDGSIVPIPPWENTG